MLPELWQLCRLGWLQERDVGQAEETSRGLWLKHSRAQANPRPPMGKSISAITEYSGCLIRIIGLICSFMTQLRISEAATFLGISDDTLRRWIADGRLETITDEAGRATVAGKDVAALMAAGTIEDREGPPTSARNRFPGIVTRVERDGVMALVEMQAGPHRIISLMSREAADELGLEPGVRAAASIKATNVVIEGRE